MPMGWRRAGGDGAGGGALSQRLASLEQEVRRLQEAHRLLLAYVRGIDDDLAELEDFFPSDGAGAGGRRHRPAAEGKGEEKRDLEALVFVECARCRRTVALAEEELGAFTDPLRCPYCGAELMKAWNAATTR